MFIDVSHGKSIFKDMTPHLCTHTTVSNRRQPFSKVQYCSICRGHNERQKMCNSKTQSLRPST